jgi:hypothetical protein
VSSRRSAAAAATPTPTDEQPPEQPPAKGWHKFTGPYPVVLMDRAQHVEPGDPVDWPDGAPDTANWEPCEAPADDAGDGDAPKES